MLYLFYRYYCQYYVVNKYSHIISFISSTIRGE